MEITAHPMVTGNEFAPQRGSNQLQLDGALSQQIESIAALALSQLREEWFRLNPGIPMPPRLTRDLVVRTITWRMQQQAMGGIRPAVRLKLARYSEQLSVSGMLHIEREVALKPGTWLVREWKGKTHRVTALRKGWLYNGRHFDSLSQVAREITGTRWSGPRFFGLKASAVVSDGDHFHG
jgi:hypothetical protein